ncbi:MAG: NADH:flavin oxidoreductase [Spirochaetales bacterium]|nr:NADH:flavin oxidoreductase [Spirochaetales bacterium]
MKVFEPCRIGNITLKNRIVRSATIMKLCDEKGVPGDEYHRFHHELSRREVGMIITGFTFVSRQGRSMHPGQAGLDTEKKIPAFKKTISLVHREGCPIVMQLAHTGRQTVRKMTGANVLGVSKRKSVYFNEKPKVLSTNDVRHVIGEFARSALYAKKAGFDGIQLHAAHGYLIHQFLLANINDRTDPYGIDRETGLGTRFLGEVIDNIRDLCGGDFPVLIKISGAVDDSGEFGREQFIRLIRFLGRKQVAAIEISYGTMDRAFNIFRGESIPTDTICTFNPRYTIKSGVGRYLWGKLAVPVLSIKFKPFSPMYNLPYAVVAKQYTDIPIITVGGFRKGEEISYAIEEQGIDFVSLSRPFLCETDFAQKVKNDRQYVSRCINCNTCAVMVDSPYPTKCYAGIAKERSV